MATLIILGSAILISFLGGKGVSRLRLPMVVGYILAGVVLGKSFLKIVTPSEVAQVSLLNDIALGIIAFLIGSELSFSRLKTLGKSIVIIAIFESLGAFILVSLSVYIFVHKVYVALILGAVASATAPAATVAVINEMKSRGPLTTTVLGVVGSDDAIALMIYAFASSWAKSFFYHKSLSWRFLLLVPFREILTAVAVGVGIGFILGFLVRKVKTKTESFALAIGFFLLAEGLAVQLHVSELLLVMSLAITASNLSPRRINSVSENITLLGFPLVAAFFCLAGTKLDISLLPRVGMIGLIYLLSRIFGKYLGANMGAAISGAPAVVRKYIGFSLWPQIGVAVALAVVVEREFGHLGIAGKNLAEMAVNILLFTTVFTEILGPLATKLSLEKAGEINKFKPGGK